jgi:outer membrane receptor for ferrienterochelin and colicins
MRRARLVSGFLMTALQIAPTHAQNAAQNAQQRLGEVVVTGTKSDSRRWDATVQTQVIPEERIQETSTIDIENALAEIPGLYVRRNEQFALGASTVRMQGADPNKVAILVDGRRFRGGIDGVVDLRDIPANNVERIEVIRGPASSLYGSDAMAGVLNIITKEGGATPHADAEVAAGSFARRFAQASHGWQLGPVRYYLSGLHDEFRLFEQYGAVSEQFAGPNRDQTQNRDQVGLRLDTDVGPHGFTLYPAYQRQTNPESTNENDSVAGEWRWKTGPGSQLTAWANRYGFRRTNALVGFEEDSDYVDWEGEPRWAVELGPGPAWASHRVTVGTRARWQTLEQGSQIIGGAFKPPVDASVWQVSPFLQSDVLVTERWSFLVGSSFDVHEIYGFDPNPRATITWRPLDVLRVSGTVGRGFRAPDLLQLYALDVNLGGLYALLGNENLEPETDLAFNLEAAVRSPGVDGFLALFRHEFEDLIAFSQIRVCEAPGRPPGCIVDPLPNLPGSLRFQTRNFAAALTEGLEMGIELAPLEMLGRASNHRPTIGIGYAFLHTENQGGLPGEDGKDLPFRPTHRVLPSVGWRYAPWRLHARVWGEWESDAFTDTVNSPDTVAREHWLWSFKVSVAPLRLLPERSDGAALARALAIGRNVELFVQGENVFDEEYGLVTAMGRLAGPAAYVGGIGFKF